jgi:hypothetical protein
MLVRLDEIKLQRKSFVNDIILKFKSHAYEEILGLVKGGRNCNS